MKHLLIIAACMLSADMAFGSKRLCPPITPEGLEILLKDRIDYQLVFFASWCITCKPHLEKYSNQPNTILIATFDERSSAEVAINHLAISAPCYTDDGVAQKLGIKSVPHFLGKVASKPQRQ